MKDCKRKLLDVKLETLDPTGVATNTKSFTMDIIDDAECKRVERLYLSIGECLYRVDNKGFIIERIVPHEKNK